MNPPPELQYTPKTPSKPVRKDAVGLPPEFSGFGKTLFLPLTICLPLGIMLLVFAPEFFLVRAEMSLRNLLGFFFAISLALLILLAVGAITRILFLRKRSLPFWGVPLLLALMCTGLTLSCLSLPRMMPDVDPFMLPPWRWMNYFFMAYMPGITYLLIRLSLLICQRENFFKVLKFLGGGLILIYLIALLLPRIGKFNIGAEVIVFSFVILSIFGGLLIFIGGIRLILGIGMIGMKSTKFRRPLILLVSLLLPVSCLLLNRNAFSVDLTAVYLLAGLNTLVLLPDGFSNPKWDLALVFFRGVVYPYRNPQKEADLLRRLVDSSRRTGVLIPQTAYLVLESEAQWKTLEQMEERKLSRSSALDIEEIRTPEPPLWLAYLLSAIFILLFSVVRRKQKRV